MRRDPLFDCRHPGQVTLVNISLSGPVPQRTKPVDVRQSNRAGNDSLTVRLVGNNVSPVKAKNNGFVRNLITKMQFAKVKFQ